MADLAKVKLPGGSVYNLKDSAARTAIENLATVASTGDYGDLLNKPIYYKTTAEWNALPTFQGNAGDICIYIDYKTISDTTTITWDGDTTGKYGPLLSAYYQVSDNVPSDISELYNNTIKYMYLNVEHSKTLTASDFTLYDTGLYGIYVEGFMVALSDITFGGATFLKGIYSPAEDCSGPKVGLLRELSWGTSQTIAGIKIADGNAYIIDKPFITSYIDTHIADTTIHTNATEKAFWNNKVNVSDTVSNETLVITRN